MAKCECHLWKKHLTYDIAHVNSGTIRQPSTRYILHTLDNPLHTKINWTHSTALKNICAASVEPRLNTISNIHYRFEWVFSLICTSVGLGNVRRRQRSRTAIHSYKEFILQNNIYWIDTIQPVQQRPTAPMNLLEHGVNRNECRENRINTSQKTSNGEKTEILANKEM